MDLLLPKLPPCRLPEEPRLLPPVEPVEGVERVRPPLHPRDEPDDEPDDEPELGCHPEPLDDGRVRERPKENPRERPRVAPLAPVVGLGLDRGWETMPTPCRDRNPSSVSTGPVPARPNEMGRVAPDGVL